MNSEWEELDFKLEDVTVWFRCDVCKGYLHSIPALREHNVKDHNVALENVKLPDNLPPGAEEGKIFFEEQVPPRKSRKGKGKVPGRSDVPEKVNAQGEAGASGNVIVQDKVNESPRQNYNIRIRDVSELVEHSSDEDEAPPNNEHVLERDKGDDDSSDHSEAQVASPPDSGMFDDGDGGSEVQEDEVNLTLVPVPVVPVTDPVPGPSSSNNKKSSASTSTPTSSKGPGKNVPMYNCSSCPKSYKSQGILNFHVKKAHPQEEVQYEDQGSPPSNSKLILKITRNANTGTFSTKNILNTDSDVDEEEKSPPGSPPTITVPSCSESDSDSDEGPVRKKKRPNRRVSRLPSSSSSSSATSKSDSDKDDTSDSSVPPAKSKSKRRRSSRRTRAKSSSPSESSASSSNASDSSSVDTRIEESSSEESEEGELTDKSTTSESEEDAGSAPQLSDYGEDKEPDADQSKKRKLASSSESEFDDLFIKVKAAPKKKGHTPSKSSKKGGERGKTKTNYAMTPQQQQQCTTVCSKCNMQCKNPNALVQHLRQLHSDDSKKPVRLLCGYCQKRYTNKRHFNRHIIAHIKEKELEKQLEKEKT